MREEVEKMTIQELDQSQDIDKIKKRVSKICINSCSNRSNTSLIGGMK